MINVQNLTKYYGPKMALNDVSFHVDRREILGFLGPNGAGKTTTMRILTAFTPPSAGIVKVDGYDVFTHSLEVRRQIGYLPESVPLYLDMTVREYLDYAAALRQVSPADKRISRTLEQVDLEAWAGTRIGKLPRGIRRRVGIAQAILHNPAVVILDEPTLGLDPKQIMDIRRFIRDLSGEHTVILSTNILSEVEQLCNRVLIINKGRIVAEDTPARLIARLEGGERIRLQTQHTPPQALDMLQALPPVARVQKIQNNVFEIEFIADSECRTMVAELVVQQGWGLLELRAIDASLEDVFLELTGESEKQG